MPPAIAIRKNRIIAEVQYEHEAHCTDCRFTELCGWCADPNANVPQQFQQGDDTQIRTFTGTVWMNGGQFVLRDESQKTWYLLDNQRSAARFEGKKVRVRGVLNAENDAIHVLGIEEDPIHRGSTAIPANPAVALSFIPSKK
jgi:hypothetical protein